MPAMGKVSCRMNESRVDDRQPTSQFTIISQEIAAHVPVLDELITLHADDLVAAAEGEIETVPAAQAVKLHGRDDVTFVDLRDIRELERDGRMPGAFHCPRGMLEFWIDPASPYHKPVFAEPKRFVFFCAGGWRSALAAKTAQDMGLENVAHVSGGFKAWREAGGPVEEPAKRQERSARA